MINNDYSQNNLIKPLQQEVDTFDAPAIIATTGILIGTALIASPYLFVAAVPFTATLIKTGISIIVSTTLLACALFFLAPEANPSNFDIEEPDYPFDFSTEEYYEIENEDSEEEYFDAEDDNPDSTNPNFLTMEIPEQLEPLLNKSKNTVLQDESTGDLTIYDKNGRLIQQ